MLVNSAILNDRLQDLRQRFEACSSDEIPVITEELFTLVEDAVQSLASCEENLKHLNHLVL